MGTKKEHGKEGGMDEGQVDETGGDKNMRRGWRLETKEWKWRRQERGTVIAEGRK